MMDSRNSISNHLALSTTTLSSPIAESTHVNGSRISVRYPWNSKVMLISPQSSKMSIVQTRGSPTPLAQIDPRIYINVQSKGLTSRIAKYHESSNKLRRSLSTGNIMYNKPGQFPVVHLKKKEITYKPNKNQNLSVVRIPPPDRTIFQANTRSSILRTGSIVPTVSLQRSNSEQISSGGGGENRPILHPAENDIAPTRSVLDALREISRKRINSDELDDGESIKKYCKETDEIIGSGNIRQSQLPIFPTSIIVKRQREGQSSPDGCQNNTFPEQITKKRLCPTNNDVASSLSSSLMMLTPKRKFNELQSSNIQQSNKNAKTDSPTPPKLKQQCFEPNHKPLRTEFVSDEITPLPPTPAVEMIKQKKAIEKTNVSSSIELKFPEVKVKPKPKLTLFNKNYDETPMTKNVNKFDDDLLTAGVAFVKPKNNSQISSGTNPLIERTKKSKLALMLSGLSGELNEDDDEDEIDGKSSIKQTTTEIQKNEVKSIDIPSISLSSASISFETKTSSITTIPAVTQYSTGQSLTQVAAATTAAIQKEIKFSTGETVISMSQLIPSTSTVTETTASGFNFPKCSTATTLAQAKPTLPGFNFGTPPKTTTGTINSGTDENASVPQFVTSAMTSKPTFSFENPSTTSNPAAPTISVSAITNISDASKTKDSISTFPATTNIAANLTAVNEAPTPPSASSIALTGINTIGLGNKLGSQISAFNTTMNANTTFALNNNPKSTFNVTADNFKPVGGNLLENKSAGGGFNFNANNNNKSNPVAVNTSARNSNNSFIFNSDFNQNAPKTTSAAVSSAFAFNTSTPSKGGFSFGPASTSATTNATANTNTTATSSSTFNLNAGNSKSSAGFTLTGSFSPPNKPSLFNNSTVTTAQGPASATNTSASSFSTGSQKVQQQQQQNKLNPFAFGGGQQTQQQKTSGIFGQTTNENKSSSSSTFIFGTPQNLQTPSTATNTINAGGASSAFGVPLATTTNVPSNLFSSQKTTIATSNTIFGASNKTVSPSAFDIPKTTSAPSMFGTPTMAAPAFGTPPTTAAGFGTSSNTGAAVFGTPNGAGRISAFGKTTSAATPTFGSPATSAFGIPATSASTFTLQQNTAASNSAFNSTENKPGGAFIFGSPSSVKPFAFTNNSNNNNNATSTTTAGTFGFNNTTTNTTTENKNLFMSAPSTSSNLFTFNAGNNNNNNNNNEKSLFNGATNNNTFGVAPLNQQKTFTFTGAAAATGASNSLTNPHSSNLFGNADNKTSDAKPFTFGTSNQESANNNNIIINNSNNNNNNNLPPFGFGGTGTGDGGVGADCSTPFSFGAAASSNTTAGPAAGGPFSTANNKTFNFGGSSMQNNNMNSVSTHPNPPAFNFSAGTNITNGGNPTVASTNLFNVGSSATAAAAATGDRVIKKATRRLQK